MQCPKCKAIASDGAKFCPKCGFALASGAPAATGYPAAADFGQPAQPQGQPLYPDVTERSGFDTGAYDPFVYDGMSQSESFANPYDQFQPVVAPQSQSFQNQFPDQYGQQPAYGQYAPQPVPAQPQYSGKTTRGSSSPAKKVIFAALDVVLIALLTFAPWLGLDSTMAGGVESITSYLGINTATSWSVISFGLAMLNDIAAPLRQVNQFASDPDIAAFITLATAVGIFVIVLWVINMVALVATLVFDIKGKRAALGYIVPVITCFIFIGVVLLLGAAILTEIGDTSYTGDVFSFMFSLVKFGLWTTLITGIGGIVARVVLK